MVNTFRGHVKSRTGCANFHLRLLWRRKLFSLKKLLWTLTLATFIFTATVVFLILIHQVSPSLVHEIGFKFSSDSTDVNTRVDSTHQRTMKEQALAQRHKSIADWAALKVTSQENHEPDESRRDSASQANSFEVYVTRSNQTYNCQSWCRRGVKKRAPFYLTAVLLVRIYVKDLAKLSTRELRQWLYYLQYAGFEHVYVYDAYVLKNESQKDALKPFIDEGYVTYTDWSHNAFPYSISGTQHSAYQHCIDRFGNQSRWQAAIDIDEYPFSPSDLQANFSQRVIIRVSSSRPEASELTMQNFLFLEKPLNDDEHPLLIDRIWRRTHGSANNLVKPIYKPTFVRRASVHHNSLLRGRSVNFNINDLRMNHYWGARLQNWGDDTPDVLARTRPDRSIEYIVRILRRCASECLPNTDFIYRKQWN